MLKTPFTLISKVVLTHDVYELTYSCPEMTKEPPKPGQYVMFQLAPGLSRAYSLASYTDDTFTLIIKRIPDGRGSPLICDAEVGTTFSGMLPLGHFMLQDTPRSKCFIGTGTGFAPLYVMCLTLDRASTPVRAHFAFGIRTYADVFYTRELDEIADRHTNFTYSLHTSREAHEDTSHGYATDIIEDPTFIERYEEYYLCGSPAMVKSARARLEELGIAKEDIHWEQY